MKNKELQKLIDIIAMSPQGHSSLLMYNIEDENGINRMNITFKGSHENVAFSAIEIMGSSKFPTEYDKATAEITRAIILDVCANVLSNDDALFSDFLAHVMSMKKTQLN